MIEFKRVIIRNDTKRSHSRVVRPKHKIPQQRVALGRDLFLVEHGAVWHTIFRLDPADVESART